jgi:hypothetical protein
LNSRIIQDKCKKLYRIPSLAEAKIMLKKEMTRITAEINNEHNKEMQNPLK